MKFMFTFFWQLINYFFGKNIPYWNTYYPSIHDQSEDKKRFYKYFCNEIEKWNYIELWESLSYVFCYLYKIINDFIFTRNIEILEIKAQNLINLYWHTKVASYVIYRQRDCYLLIKDYEKAREKEKQLNFWMSIGKLLFYSKKGVFSGESWQDFLKTFWSSCLTKFWKENIDWVEQALDIFLKDFKLENGLWPVDFFCQDFQNPNITDEDVEKYRIFFKSNEEFETYKSYDLTRYWRDESLSPYIRNEDIMLFWWVRIEEKNSRSHISEESMFIKWYWTVTIRTTLPTSLPEVLSTLKTEVIWPWYVIRKALSNYAKSIIKEAENTYREESWIPKIWEGRVSETELFYKIKTYFPNEKVIHHGRPERLGRQHLDIYFPERNIWIEYQWKQHIEPVTYFWWEAAFEKQQYRDKQKAKKCKKNNCHLIYVYEGYSFDEVAKNISQLLDEQNMR